MKRANIKVLLMLVMLTVSTTGYGDDEAAASIDWLKNIDTAKSQALKENKIIMVDVYTDWCHWCKELDKKVFTDKKVIDLSEKIVNLKLNAEDRGPGQMLARKYGVGSYPTILFINSKGEEVDRIGGFLPAPRFALELQRIIAGKDTFLSLKQGHEKGSLSLLQLCTLANSYLGRNKIQQAGLVVKDVDVTKAKTEDEAENAIMTKFNFNYVSRNFADAESLLQHYISKYSHREMYPNSLYYMVVTKTVMGKKNEAEKYLAELKSKFGDRKEMISRAQQVMASY